MAVLRFFVVFLLGLGAAIGAYATGGLDYLAHEYSTHQFGLSSWLALPSRGMILRVASGDCPARYVVDNQSSQRLLVEFAPRANVMPAGYEAPQYGREEAPPGYNQPPGSQNYPGRDYPPPEDSGPAPQGPDSREQYDPRDEYGPQGPQAQEDEPRYGGYGSDVTAGQGLWPRQGYEPTVVHPGERKLIQAFNGGDMQSQRCGDSRAATLQLTDCAIEGSGLCGRAMAPPGGAPEVYKGVQ